MPRRHRPVRKRDVSDVLWGHTPVGFASSLPRTTCLRERQIRKVARLQMRKEEVEVREKEEDQEKVQSHLLWDPMHGQEVLRARTTIGLSGSSSLGVCSAVCEQPLPLGR